MGLRRKSRADDYYAAVVFSASGEFGFVAGPWINESDAQAWVNDHAVTADVVKLAGTRHNVTVVGYANTL